MKYPINIDRINDSSVDFRKEALSLAEEAKNYLESFHWCGEILDGWLFTNIGAAFCTFLFEIRNLQSPEDNLLWVVVGDLPPMYLDTYNVSSTREVVENYIDIVNDWVEHAENDKSLEECYPLVSDTTLVSLNKLKKRTEFMEKNLLPSIDDLDFKAIYQL